MKALGLILPQCHPYNNDILIVLRLSGFQPGKMKLFEIIQFWFESLY
jgi:hypothetical protein